MEAMADTQIHEAEAQSERNQCGVCNMHASAPSEAVDLADPDEALRVGARIRQRLISDVS